MKPAPAAPSKPAVAWTPLRNYFALVATTPEVPDGFVLFGRDSLATLYEDRKVWQRISGGTLRIVWGIDGAVVTAKQAALMLQPRGAEEYVLEELAGGGVAKVPSPRLGPHGVLPPLHPKQLRPEALGEYPVERKPFPLLDGEGGVQGCKACAVRARNLLVAEPAPSCDSVGTNAPKSAEPRQRRPDRPHAPPQAVHDRAREVLPQPREPGDDAGAPVPLRRGSGDDARAPRDDPGRPVAGGGPRCPGGDPRGAGEGVDQAAPARSEDRRDPSGPVRRGGA